MDAQSKIKLFAFLTALAKQESPLPAEYQQQLHNIANAIAPATTEAETYQAISTLAIQLHAIARQAGSPLAQAYTKTCVQGLKPTATKQKASVPDLTPEHQTQADQENSNLAVDIAEEKENNPFDDMSNNQIIEKMQNILQDPNSVEAAKNDSLFPASIPEIGNF